MFFGKCAQVFAGTVPGRRRAPIATDRRLDVRWTPPARGALGSGAGYLPNSGPLPLDVWRDAQNDRWFARPSDRGPRPAPEPKAPLTAGSLPTDGSRGVTIWSRDPAIAI